MKVKTEFNVNLLLQSNRQLFNILCHEFLCVVDHVLESTETGVHHDALSSFGGWLFIGSRSGRSAESGMQKVWYLSDFPANIVDDLLPPP